MAQDNLLFDVPGNKRKRKRDREGAIKSDRSYIKQTFNYRVLRSQAHSYRVTHPHDPMTGIDGNAGDGQGVALPQADLFEGDALSVTSAGTMALLGAECAMDVILSETNAERRTCLHRLFPQVLIIDTHDKAPDYVCADCRYVLWSSDPCGYSKHGIEAMRRIARRPGLRSDFVIVLNEQALKRAAGTVSKVHAKTRTYLPMLEPLWWAEQLGKRQVARSKLINQTSSFQFRLLVVADYLGDVVRRDFPDVFDR